MNQISIKLSRILTTKKSTERNPFLVLLTFLLISFNAVVWGQVEITPIRSTVSGFSTWSDVNVLGSTYLQLTSSNSSTITPTLNFDNYTSETLSFRARTYGGTSGSSNVITISISVDNGNSWTVLGTRIPTTNGLLPMTFFDLSSYNGSQVKLRFQSLNGTGTVGVGISEIKISGIENLGPNISTSASSLSGLTYTVGSGPSASSSFTLTGANLDGTAVTASLGGSNYEISTDNSTFSSTLNLGTATAISQLIYVRLKAGLAENSSYSDVITITGGGATTNATVTLNGSVTPIATPVITSSNSQTFVYGSSVSYQITASGGPTSYAATNLPSGLTLNTSTGLISGTITQAVGSHSSTVSATNLGGTGSKSLTWNITPKALTITGVSVSNKEYDATTAATIIGTPTLVGVVGSDDVVIAGAGSASFATKTAGTNKAVTFSGFILSGTKAGNYTLTQPITAADITKKTITVSGAAAQNKVYDGGTTATITVGTPVGNLPGDVVTVSGNGTFAQANVGNGIAVTANLTLSGTDATNYTITQPTGLSAIITKADPVFTTAIISINVGGSYNLPGTNISSTSSGLFTYNITSGGNAVLSGTVINGSTVGSETLTVNQVATTNYNAGSTTVTVNVTIITYINGDYRTTGSGTWVSNNASPAIWQRYNGTNWATSNSPSFNTTNNVYIEPSHSITAGGSFSNGIKLHVKGSFTVASSSTTASINVYSEGILTINGNLTNNGDFIVDDEGVVNINNRTNTLWNGTEKFAANSKFYVDYARQDELFFASESSISSHPTTGAKFGYLIIQPSTFNSTSANWTGIIPVGTYKLTEYDFIINNNSTFNFTLNGGDVTVGRDFIVNVLNSGVVATQSEGGVKSITVNGDVIKNGSGIFRLNGSGIFTLTVLGDFKLNTGTFNSLAVNSAAAISTIDLKKHFIANSGTIITNNTSSNNYFNSIYRFSGTVNQNVQLEGTYTINCVETDKTLGVVNLITDLKIRNRLKMISGNVTTNLNNLELGISTSSLGELDHTSGYVVGKMKRWFSGTNAADYTTSLFPMGFDEGGLKKRFAEVNYTSSPSGGSLTTQFIGSAMGTAGLDIPAANTGGFGQIVSTTEDQGYWQIDNTDGNLTNGVYTISLTGEGFNIITDVSKLTLLKRVGGGNWYCPGVHQASSGTPAVPKVTRSGVTGWSNFGFGAPKEVNPLPIELTTFAVDCSSNEFVDVNWTTASELNNDYFVIEKSTDGALWEKVAEIDGQGNSTILVNYSFTDFMLHRGLVYYRLSQVDLDGTRREFNPLSTSCSSMSAVTIYPNPAIDQLLVEIQNQDLQGDLNIELTTIDGKIVYQTKVKPMMDKILIPVNVSTYESGIYLLRVKDATSVLTTEKVRIGY